MGAMLTSSISQYPAVFAASAVLIFVSCLFVAIGIWVMRPESRPLFEQASRLPLEGEEGQ